jgi:hypothetical protein
MKRVCVFCGSKHGVAPAYAESANALGRTLVAHKLGLVYGGGTVGLMGEVARTVQAGLGPQAVLGVIPAALTPREVSAELIGDTKVCAALCCVFGCGVWRQRGRCGRGALSRSSGAWRRSWATCTSARR